MKKPVLILCHVCFWVFHFFAIPFLFTIPWMITHMLGPHGPGVNVHMDTAYSGSLVVMLIGAGVFYAAYASLPFFLRRPLRFLWIVACYLGYNMLVSLPADVLSFQAMVVLGPLLYFNAGGFFARASLMWLKDRQLTAELEKDKLASQLELLKTKIDPHFLFNNLNNIDVFIQDEPQRASEYLKKLSDILRFMLYEANAEKISLAAEIEYIRKYIDLQKIRTANANFVKLEINGEVGSKTIFPMILIHFIENAFKYATNKKVEQAIAIRLDVAAGRMSFSCKNHIHAAKELSAEKSGLGISLLRQKLDLLYKKDYRLITKEENDWYLVNLQIRLDEN